MRPILSDIKGLGPSSVKALASKGIKTVEDLAQADIVQIRAVPGFGEARAASVKAAAAQLVRSAAATETAEKAGAKPKAVAKKAVPAPAAGVALPEVTEAPVEAQAPPASKEEGKKSKPKKPKKAKKDKKDKKGEQGGKKGKEKGKKGKKGKGKKAGK